MVIFLASLVFLSYCFGSPLGFIYFLSSGQFFFFFLACPVVLSLLRRNNNTFLFDAAAFFGFFLFLFLFLGQTKTALENATTSAPGTHTRSAAATAS